MQLARSCGLGVNPDKTELILFTTRTEILSFNLPRLNFTELKLSSKARSIPQCKAVILNKNTSDIVIEIPVKTLSNNLIVIKMTSIESLNGKR